MFGTLKRFIDIERSLCKLWEAVNNALSVQFHENSTRLDQLELWYKQEHCKHEMPELIWNPRGCNSHNHYISCKECGKILITGCTKSKEYMIEHHNKKAKEYREKI